MKNFKPQNFRPIRKEKLVTSIRLESDILEIIDKLSVQNDLSRNEFIVQCIKYALNNM